MKKKTKEKILEACTNLERNLEFGDVLEEVQEIKQAIKDDEVKQIKRPAKPVGKKIITAGRWLERWSEIIKKI